MDGSGVTSSMPLRLQLGHYRVIFGAPGVITREWAQVKVTADG